jgi:hypothetical protein
MIFFGVKQCFNDIFASTILQLDKVKLHLELFHLGNLIHFQPEQRKSCQTSTRFEWSGKKILNLARACLSVNFISRNFSTF